MQDSCYAQSNGSTFVPANNPANIRYGRGGHFYKNSLPVIVRADLSIDESIVAELKFSRKIYFLLFCIVLLLSTMVSCKKIEIYTLILCSG